MIGGSLQIDQTPCRASYGLLTPSARLEDTANVRYQQFLADVGDIAAEGDRMARAYNRANSIPEIAAEKYISQQPPEVGLVYIARPIIDYVPAPGSRLDITV